MVYFKFLHSCSGRLQECSILKSLARVLLAVVMESTAEISRRMTSVSRFGAVVGAGLTFSASPGHLYPAGSELPAYACWHAPDAFGMRSMAYA